MFVSLKERDATFKDRKRYEDKYFHLAIEGGLAYVKWLKNKVEQVFLSLCNCSCIIPFLVKT